MKVAFIVQRFKKMGCFMTVTKDGILQFWSETFSVMNSFRVSQVFTGLVERASVVAPWVDLLLALII